MRLEDWQKYIATQFLEENNSDKSETVSSDLSTDTLPSIISEGEMPIPVFSVDSRVITSATSVQSASFQPLEDAPARANRKQSLALYPIQDTNPSSPVALKPVASTPLIFTALEADIPDFQSFMSSEMVADPLNKVDDIVASREIDSPAVVEIDSNNDAHPKINQEIQPTQLPNQRWVDFTHRIELMRSLIDADESIVQASYTQPFSESREEFIHDLLNPVLTLEETARLLNVCPSTVRRYSNKGLLPSFRKELGDTALGGATLVRETRRRKFRLLDVLDFISARGNGQLPLAIDSDETMEAI